MGVSSEMLVPILFLPLFLLSVPVHEIGHVIAIKIISWIDRKSRIEIAEVNLLNFCCLWRWSENAGYVTYFVFGRLTLLQKIAISFSGGAFASIFFGLISLLFSGNSIMLHTLILVSVGQFIIGFCEAADKFIRGEER